MIALSADGDPSRLTAVVDEVIALRPDVFAQSGGLFTYGPRESFKRLVYYAARILAGAKPSDLPVESPGHVELVINLRTANQIGLTVPGSLMALADEVIEWANGVGDQLHN